MGVVELFTSQGCSSCPPADAVLGELVRAGQCGRAQSYHVDYWNYLGWEDTFSSKQSTDRQYDYAARSAARASTRHRLSSMAVITSTALTKRGIEKPRSAAFDKQRAVA